MRAGRPLPFIAVVTTVVLVGFAPGVAQTQQELCEAAGLVVSIVDGQPLRSAVVTLSPSGRRSNPITIRTDANGRFAFSNVPPGNYRLSVDRTGYVRQEYGQRSFNRRGVTLNLSPGQRLNDLLFRMTPAGVITGHVYDELGEPVVGVVVNVLRRMYRQGEPVLESSRGDRSDDRGQYRIFNLAPGKYVISATPVGMGSGRIREGGPGEREAYVPTFYPGVTNPDDAVLLEILAGQEVSNIDFTLVPQNTVSVRGRVVGASDGTRPQVVLAPRSGRTSTRGRRRQTRVEPDGSFEISGVTPGSYILAATESGLNVVIRSGSNVVGEVQNTQSSSSYAREAIEVGNSDVDGITLALAPNGSAAGRVVVEGGQLPEGRIFVQLRATELFARNSNSRIKPDGAFEVRNVAPGDYQVSVGGLPPDYYLKSVRRGNEEFTSRMLPLAGDTTGLELVVSPSGARVEGQVLTDENLPATAVTVVLVPAPELRAFRSHYETAGTDALGRFVIRGIAPGEYTLYAWETEEGEIWMDPDFLAHFREDGVSVRLTEGAAQSAQLTLLLSPPF